MERLKDTVKDFIYTIVNEQRSMTGEFSRSDADSYADMLLLNINEALNRTHVIDGKAMSQIMDIGARMIANRVPAPSYPAQVMLALEEYLLCQGIKPCFRVVNK